MTLLTSDTIGALSLGDASLLGVEWEQEGRDIVLRSDGRSGRLACTWASGMRIALDWGANEGGLALSFDFRYERRERGWWLELSFPPQGSLELECDAVRLEYDAP